MTVILEILCYHNVKPNVNIVLNISDNLSVFSLPEIFILLYWKMSVKIVSHPGHGYPRQVESRASGLGCRYLKM